MLDKLIAFYSGEAFFGFGGKPVVVGR